jgi:hypothetical protein
MCRGHNVVRNIVAEKFARSAFDSDESDESLPHPHQPRHTRNAQLKKNCRANIILSHIKNAHSCFTTYFCALGTDF